jgi:hypothetical protein
MSQDGIALESLAEWGIPFPEELRELADHIGEADALKLLNEYGQAGYVAYVPLPSGLAQEHPLAALLGEESARRLAGIYGLEHRVPVPGLRAVKRAIRDKGILADHGRGLTRSAIAKRHGLSARAVQAILARARAGGRA